MRQMIDKITERYLQEREHILEQTIHDIIYWKTPKHGYRSREEMLSDKRYQELTRWKFVTAGFMKSIFRKKWQN